MAGGRGVQGQSRSATARARSATRRRSDQRAGEGRGLMEQSAAEVTISRRETSVWLPTLFLPHGSPMHTGGPAASPMHAVEPGAAGLAWAALARELPRPRAVLIASAHWETSVPLLTGNP